MSTYPLLAKPVEGMTAQERNDIAMLVRPFEFAIGRLLMNFGTLELSLLKGIAELLPFTPTQKLDEKAPRSFGPAVEKYKKLVSLATPAVAGEPAHVDLIAKLQRFGEERNDYVHGAWFDMPGTDIDRTKGKLDREETLLQLSQAVKPGRRVSPNEIIDFSNRVIELRILFDSHRATVVGAANAARGIPGKADREPKGAKVRVGAPSRLSRDN